MKQLSIICISLSFLLLSLTGCYKTIEKMGNSATEVALSYPAVNQYNLAASGIDYWNKALINPDLGNSTDTLNFSLNIPRALKNDLTVNIGIDEAAVATYNKDTIFGPTQYSLMPSDYYTIVNPVATLPAGTTNLAFKVAIKPAIFDISKTGYILPVSIISANGIAVSSMKTAYIHIEKDPNPPYSRTDWTVSGFSSEEAVGEGPGNGRVVNLFDNNNSTFWHSQWKDASPGPPHWFVIDMHNSNVLHGIMFLDRQGVGSDGRPKDVKVEVSNDNITWTTAGDLKLGDTNKWQKITFSKPTNAVRYLKVTINSMYGASTTKYSNLAELKVF